MNINKLISRLKDTTGLGKFLDLCYTDEEIYDIIEMHCLEEWSHYFRYPVAFNDVYLTNDSQIAPDLYSIPEDIMSVIRRTGLDVMDGVAKYRTNLYGNTVAGSNLTMYSDFMSVDQLYAGMTATRQLGGIDMYMNYLHACYFEKPDRLRFNYANTNPYNDSLELKLFIEQPHNLLGISETREHDFYQLCVLTLKSILWANVGRYAESMETGKGTVNLGISDWANAENERLELLKQLQEYATLEQGRSRVM